MAPKSYLLGLTALLVVGCGPQAAGPPPVSVPTAPSATPEPSRPPRGTTALTVTGVPAALRPALQAAWAGFHRPTPQWTGAVAAPGTVIYTGTDTTTAQGLRTAWGVAHAAGALPGGVLTGAVTTGHDDQGGFPAVGPPRGTANLSGHGANVAWVTGTVPWPGGARGFRALLARLTTGWVLVTWTWQGGAA